MRLKSLRALTLGFIGLALFSCEDNNNPIKNRIDEPSGTKTFELSAKMGEVAIEPIANNTNPEVDDDELRATLHFNNTNAWATTSYKWDEFGVGAGKTNARWGAILGANLQPDAKSCTRVTETEITSTPILGNTIWFNILGSKTIAGQKLKMYCQTGGSFGGNVVKSWMCLGGRPGGDIEPELTRQYFKIGEESNPNKLIAGLKAGEKQEGRDIPVMTHVRPYIDFKQKADGGQADATFAPRGSLIGLIINNKLARTITVTDIIVRKDNALNFSGYFDWNVKGALMKHAKFEPQYPNGNTAIIIPVKQDGTNNVIVANNDDSKKHNDNPTIFYLWGIQDLAKKGQPLRVQIRYKSTVNGVDNTVLTTRTFRVYPGKTKAEGEQGQFEEGRAYKTILKLDEMQQKGGTYEDSQDWRDGEDYVENVKLNAINPLQFVAKYDIAKTNVTDGSAELKFVSNHNIKANIPVTAPETDYKKFKEGTDVGFYTWAEAMRLFGYDVDENVAPTYNANGQTNDEKYIKGTGWETLDKQQFKTPKYKDINGQEYYIPNIKEWTAIIPYWISPEASIALQNVNQSAAVHLNLVSFNNKWNEHLSDAIYKVRTIGYPIGKLGLEDVQIGDILLRKKDYIDEYITKQIGDSFVTYAIRFRGTKFESAWRYEYRKSNKYGSIDTYDLVIQNVMLWKNSDRKLYGIANNVATEEFFNTANTIERIFPAYGKIVDKKNRTIIIISKDYSSHCWARDYKNFRKGHAMYFNGKFALSGSTFQTDGAFIRPFARNHY